MPLEKALCFNEPFLGKGNRQEKPPLAFYFQLLMTVTTATEQSLPLVRVRVRCPKRVQAEGIIARVGPTAGWCLIRRGQPGRTALQGNSCGIAHCQDTGAGLGRLNLEKVIHQGEAQMKRVKIIPSLEKWQHGPLYG